MLALGSVCTVQDVQAEEQEQKPRHLAEDGFSRVDEGGERDEQCGRPPGGVPANRFFCVQIGDEGCQDQDDDGGEARDRGRIAEELDHDRRGHDHLRPDIEDERIPPPLVEHGEDVPAPGGELLRDDHEEAVVVPRRGERADLAEAEEEENGAEGELGEPMAESFKHSFGRQGLYQPNQRDSPDRRESRLSRPRTFPGSRGCAR